MEGFDSIWFVGEVAVTRVARTVIGPLRKLMWRKDQVQLDMQSVDDVAMALT